MSIHRKTNLPVLADRVTTLESSKRRNLIYLVTAMLVLFGIATVISVVGL